MPMILGNVLHKNDSGRVRHAPTGRESVATHDDAVFVRCQDSAVDERPAKRLREGNREQQDSGEIQRP